MPTSKFDFGTPEYWRERADEARALADDMVDEEARLAMLAVAQSYEKIAVRAETRRQSLQKQG